MMPPKTLRQAILSLPIVGVTGRGIGMSSWRPGPTVRIGPAPASKGSMPAKDRLGRDEEGCPPCTRNDPTEDTDDCSIRPGEAGTGGLAPEHGQLMAQHENLCVLGHRAHPVNVDRLEEATDESVEE